MPFETRSRGRLPTPGPFLAEITNHLDPTAMGSLEVSLIKNLQSSVDDQGGTFIVRYLNPFYGVTSVRYEGNNSSDFNDVQKSYGMWMVPPDVGTTVMVIFIDGDPNQGYWMGCVQDTFQNHMMPGIAASKQTSMTQEQKDRYGTEYLPVAEFLKGSQRLNNPNVDKIPKPVHPFADRLLAQGLLLDTVRGVTSSSARREVPSQVFGISTPGPLDTSPGAKKGKIGYEGNRQAPVSRLGGSTFVMDDGDINGQNELVRIRTRTGHQILLHNSHDLIYIANAKGTAWIEMTSHGKLDIYAQDSVSIHTENDFNFRADRDVNIEAGRNINMRALKNMETNVNGFYYLVVEDHGKISVKNDLDIAVGENLKFSANQDMNLSAGADMLMTSNNNMDISAGKAMKQGAGADFSVGANGNYYESASKIHMNGPAAPAPASAQPAVLPPLLPTFNLPNRSGKTAWAKDNKYATKAVDSIMQRMPTHEPYDQHENVNPQKFSSDATDVSLKSRASSGVAASPNTGIQNSANDSTVVPGTCDPKYAKDINSSSAQEGISALKAAAASLGLTEPIAIASLLGIAGGESRWKSVTESFNYTSAARLLEVFPTVFKGDATLAQQYVGNPNNSLPEFLYGYTTAKGKGLGNTQAGDGANFIGRGFIQITGRSNYARYSQLLFTKGLVKTPTALVDSPNMLSDLTMAAQVSVLYFLDRVKLSQTDPGYFEAACKAVGFNTPDIHATKQGFYECFLAQLTGGTVGVGTNGILTDSQGNPVKTGQ
jgi:putative chitinase